MPTLVDIQLPEGSSAGGPLSQQDVADDASETILFDDVSTVLSQKSRAAIDESTMLLSPVNIKKNSGEIIPRNLTDAYDDVSTILSRSLIGNQHTEDHDKKDDNRLIYDAQEDHDDAIRPEIRRGESQAAMPHPNQDLYREKYQDFVNSTIADFQNKHPGKLRDYRLMAVEEKEQAQRYLLDLLSRLGITRGMSGGNGEVSMRESQSHRHNTSDRHDSHGQLHHGLEETVLSISPQISRKHTVSFHHDVSFLMEQHSPSGDHDESYMGADKSELLLSPGDPGDFQKDADKSALLLSPGGFQQEEQHQQSMEHSDTSFGFQNDRMDDSGEESVEVVRADKSISSYSNSYDSPEHNRPNPHKRLASSSGKRGADMVRQRLSQESTPSLTDPRRDSNSEIDISSHMHRLSISPPDLFEASQSPIPPRLTYGSSDDETDESFDNCRRATGNSQRRGTRARESDVTIDTVESGYKRSDQGDNNSKRRAMREIPVNVKLAPGATFHLDKLHVTRTEMERTEKSSKKKGIRSRVRRMVNFPDPLVHYSKRHRRVLKDIFEWIDESEEQSRGDEDGPPAGCIIFSLTYKKIVDLALKVLLKDPSANDRSIDQHSDSNNLRGQTIIVVRTKEDLSKWETALREGTGCSVMNHATLSLSERVRASTAEKAARYDVVLTTFDALKSPDIAIPVSELGHAIVSKPVSNDGWYSKNSWDNTAPRTCKQLSVLHHIEFKRIVFTDVLGRKSFLAKHGTARAAAALALRGDGR
jgi:hypothetical protein